MMESAGVFIGFPNPHLLEPPDREIRPLILWDLLGAFFEALAQPELPAFEPYVDETVVARSLQLEPRRVIEMARKHQILAGQWYDGPGSLWHPRKGSVAKLKSIMSQGFRHA